MIKSKVLLCFCVLCGVVTSAFADPTTITPGGKPSVSGYIKDAANGEALIGATVYIKEVKSGTSSNIYGFYSVSADKGEYTLVYSYLGYVSMEVKVVISGNNKVDIELTPESTEIKEVVVRGERANANISRPEMSVAKLEMKSIKQIPALMGEVDVIKAIQMLPGVQSTSEGSSGFSVRGGSSDQNQIMLDEAIVFNASHLMGFFSVFNNDFKASLYKD